MKFDWEDIFYLDHAFSIACTTWRAKVPGGWLVTNLLSTGNNFTSDMIFLSDPTHSWVIEKEEKKDESQQT